MVERHLTARELAALTGIREGTLAAWRSRENKRPDSKPIGPRWKRFGRAVRYPESGVSEWMGQRELRPFVK